MITKYDVTTLPNKNMIASISQDTNNLDTGSKSSLENDTKRSTMLPFSDGNSYSGAGLDYLPIYINTTIEHREITLKNTSTFISNSIIINTTISTNAFGSCNILIQNCTFEGGKLEIDSASNVTIQNSHFLVQHVSEDKTSDYILIINNTDYLFIYNTFCGNVSTKSTELTGNTSLGVKLENVILAEMKKCIFTGIKSDESGGVALFVKSTELILASSYFQNNSGEYSIIHATDSVKITSSNTSFTYNHAGAVIYIKQLSSLSNKFCKFQNNRVRELGAVVFIMRHTILHNYRCLFQYNFGRVIYMRYNSQLMNEEVII